MVILLICILLAIILIACYLYYAKNVIVKEVVNAINSKEYFSNKEKNKPNNLIKNGDFENGKHSANMINQNGYNKIVAKRNPGKTPYVLEQKKTDNLTYYELLIDNNKNSKYNLYLWLSVDSPTNKNIDELDFNRFINIKMQNEDYSNYIPRLNYNIIQKVKLSNEESNSWYLLKYDFISGHETTDKMQMFINYNDNMLFDAYYITGLSMYKVLIDAENFIYNEKLICYADGYDYQSNIPTWRDLSGNGNDLFWSRIPIADYTKGSLNSDKLKITGFPSSNISNAQMTIIFCLNKNIENKDSDTSVDENNNTADFYLLSLPGNDRYAFEIKIKDNYLYLVVDNNEYQSSSKLVLYNKSLLAITYDSNNNIINVYEDGVNILSASIPKIYLSNDNFTINKNKNLNYNFYGFLIYDRVVDIDEMTEIRDYFIMNQNKDKNKILNNPDINQLHLDDMDLSINFNSIKPFNKKDDKNELIINNNFIDTFDNKNYKNQCLNKIQEIENFRTRKYHHIGNNKNMDNIAEEENNVHGNGTIQEENNKNNNNSYNNNNNNTDCPKVYKKDGKYMVYVSPISKYAKLHHYSGEKSYGTNIDKAKYTYHVNFPKCPIPDELIAGSDSKNENCPFIINELNPCYISHCANVNWETDDHNGLNINKNCKKAVSNYCHINYQLDEKCEDWNPKNKDNKKSIEHRRFFEDPSDYCNPKQFNIEDHPDFDKYIKKDSIPCWGCNLE